MADTGRLPPLPEVRRALRGFFALLQEREDMELKRVVNGICVALGFVCLGVGCVGIALPILPTTPFLLLALVLFAKGSERFHRWFLSTGIYRKYLKDFVATRTMEKGTKIRILAVVTILLGAGIVFSPVYAKVILAVVLVCHYGYFLFGIKTV